MSTGFWDINSEADYYNGSTQGSYQYQELNELIATFMAYYVGENKIISKASKEDVAFFSRRAAQELSYDTLRSKETWEFDVPNSSKTVFPHNFVGYTNVYWSSPGGVKRPLYPTRLTQNPFRPTVTDEPFEQTITTETITDPQIIENEIPSDTKVYVFYDGTSMGQTQVETAYQAVTQWLDNVTGFTRQEDNTQANHNVFHTSVAGERWLDWASVPMTGKFNNRQIKASMDPLAPGSQVSFTDQVVDDPLYRRPMVSQGHPDHITATNTIGANSLALKVSYWSSLAGSATAGNQFYDVSNPTGSGIGAEAGAILPTENSNGVAVNVTLKGAPPQISSNDNVLVIIFADESQAAYHGEGAAPTFSHVNQDDINFIDNSNDFDQNQPTSIWKQDYEEFKENYNNHTGKFNAFLYPREQVQGGGNPTLGQQRIQFIPHALAAISSGNQDVPDGTWKDGTSPTFDAFTYGNAANDVSLSILEATPPLGGYDVANPNPNPYWNQMSPQYGGLDQYGFGTNVDGGPLLVDTIIEDLNDFVTGSVEQEIINNTYEVTTITETGQDYWQINDDGSVAGSYGGVTQQEFMSGDFGEPLVVDQDYDHSYGNVSMGQRYGIVPEHAQVNGSYFMDYKNGCIFFNPSLIGQTVVLDYLSDGIDASGNMMIHKFAEEAFYKHVAYAIASTGANYSPATVQMLKKEKFAATRRAKIRLSNFKSQEFAQIMRNKAQWIKR